MKTYELFTGQDLEIAEKIQQRRYQILIHSCLYYHFNTNIISDKKWDEWARELRDLQKQYLEISKQVTLYEEFKDWDASTGAFLPIERKWVMNKAQFILSQHGESTKVQKKPEPVKKKSAKKKLF